MTTGEKMELPLNTNEKTDEIAAEELQMLVNTYKVGDPSKINKKDGKIYHGDEPIEKWFATMEKLYGRDDDEPYWNK